MTGKRQGSGNRDGMTREARLKAALKANIARRKAAAREQTHDPASEDGADEGTDSRAVGTNRAADRGN